MAVDQRYEKPEKLEKQEEKDEKEEKGREEKWQRDRLSAVVWAAVLIWAGLVLLADNLGLLARLEPVGGWSLVFAGAGLIVILEGLVRLAVPAYRRPVLGTFILGAILLLIGLGDLLTWQLIGPLILVAIGLVILVKAVMRST